MSEREAELEGILQRVLAALHDAAQVTETPENGIRQTIHCKVLLDIIGDAVECPDCVYWQEHYGDGGVDLTDEEAAEALRFDAEFAQDLELDRKLRERP